MSEALLENIVAKRVVLEKELGIDLYIDRNDIVQRASCSVTHHQGERGILVGRNPREIPYVASHLFGYSGGSHQQAATIALEHAWGAKVPKNARLLRAIGQAAEIMQSSVRWIYTAFGPGLAHPAFSGLQDSDYIRNHFLAFKGTSFRRGILGATFPMSVYAAIAGQWPQARFACPGGIGTIPDAAALARVSGLLSRFRTEWLEGVLLHTSVDEFLDIRTSDQLFNWIDSAGTHPKSDLAAMLSGALERGYLNLGDHSAPTLTYGAFHVSDQEEESIHELLSSHSSIPGLCINGSSVDVLSRASVRSCIESLGQSHQTWYQGQPTEVGPLARMLSLHAVRPEGNLIGHMVSWSGKNAFARILARIREIMVLENRIRFWLAQIDPDEPWNLPVEDRDGWGLGLTEAPRGALAHLVRIRDGKVADYQILPPTLLNVSSGSGDSPIESALSQLEIPNRNSLHEVGIIARSFDASVSCKVRLLKHPSGKVILTSDE